MSLRNLPPLPDVWGNYALKDFQEFFPPEAISWLPQTRGWAVVGALLLIVLLLWGRRRALHWHRNRYRRSALEQLQQLAQQSPSTAVAGQLSILLKATALQVWPRADIAALSGEPWTRWLQQTAPTACFDAEDLEVMQTAAYAPVTELGAEQIQRLSDAAERWIRQHQFEVVND